ncbi:MAG: hypothetical protein CME61_03830 [Halobacteriovoraceae bacterium]|nr:hypothetical protein [Halobacteriovoraceae bacterium]
MKLFVLLMTLSIFSSVFAEDFYSNVSTDDPSNFDEVYKDLELKKDTPMDSLYDEVKNVNSNSIDSWNKNLDSSITEPKNLEEAFEKNKNWSIKGSRDFSFKYFSSMMLEPKNNSLFKNVFLGSDSSQIGPLSLDYHSPLAGKENGLGYYIGISISFAEGKSVSTNGGVETKLKLLTIPIDFGFSLFTHSWSWLRLKTVAGVTGAGMVQERDDYLDTEKGKYMNRLGAGYFGLLKMEIPMSGIFTSSKHDFYSTYGFTNYYLDISFKYQDLSFFGDGNSLDFNGSAVGIGITFETL